MRDWLETLALLAFAVAMGIIANVGCVPYDPDRPERCHAHPWFSSAEEIERVRRILKPPAAPKPLAPDAIIRPA
jgi:hypothetical protein